MTFAFKGLGGTAVSSSPNQATATLTTTTTIGAAGDLAVLVYAMDNQAITDGDENAVTSVISTADNTWIKAKEFTNGQAAIQAGATVGLWFCNLVKPIPIGTAITLTIGNPPARDATALSLAYFTEAANFSAVVEATNSLAVDGAALGSLNATTGNIACLRIRATASESSTATAWTKTAAFDGLFGQVVTSGGATAVNQGIRAEYDISAGTGVASQPTGGAGNVDHASIYVAWREVASQILTPPVCDDGYTIFAPGEMSYYFLSGYMEDVDVVHETTSTTTRTLTSLDAHDDRDYIFAADVQPSDVMVVVDLVMDEEEIFAAMAEVVSTPAVGYVGHHDDTDTFHEPGVSSIWIIFDDVHDDSDDLIEATVVSSSVIIHFGVISFDEVVTPAIVSQFDWIMEDVEDPDIFPGSDALSESEFGMGYHAPDDQFFVTTFGTGDGVLEPLLVIEDEIFHAAVVTGAGATQPILPVMHANDDVIHAHDMGGVLTLAASQHLDNDVFPYPFTGQRRIIRSSILIIGDRDAA